MNSAQLLACFNRIGEAPDAVQRLRQFVTELAVRGRLVPQDPHDGPAEKLLTCIVMLKRAQSIKTTERTSYIDPSTLHGIPETWTWCRFGELILDFRYGTSQKCSEVSHGVPVLRIPNIKNGRIDPTDIKYAEMSAREFDLLRLRRGDLLLVRSNGSENLVGRSAVITADDEQFAYAGYLVRARIPSEFIFPPYLHVGLSTTFVRRQIEGPIRTTTGVKNINTSELSNLILPVPPFAEQHRIVAKVDELMALCDRLEAAQAEREKRRDRLVSASLQRLSEPDKEPERFREHVRFHLRHFPRLIQRRDQIQQLRGVILSLAVQGALVPQDSAVEPAAAIIDKISELRTQTRARASKVASEAIIDSGGVPEQWALCRLGDLVLDFRYGTSRKCSRDSCGVPVLRIPNIQNGQIKSDDLKFTEMPSAELDSLRLREGDILLVRSNGSEKLVGRSAVVSAAHEGFVYAGYLVRARLPNALISSEYLHVALSTPRARRQIEGPIRTTTGVKNINATELSNLVVPLPPTIEQHRIVAKVDELTALCDRLESQLDTAKTAGSCFLEAILHQALAPIVSREQLERLVG